jgi:YHS domain-containing protein
MTAAWAFWRLVDGIIETFGGTTEQRRKGRRVPSVKLVRDPVCGTWVSPSDARFVQIGSAMHYFCSDECRAKFQRR